jgi:hypothetical protein
VVGGGERRSRETHLGPHLKLGRLVERDRRRRADCRLRRPWWRRWELGGERRKCLGGAWRGGERRRLFIGGDRRYPGPENTHAELVLASQWRFGRLAVMAADET